METVSEQGSEWSDLEPTISVEQSNLAVRELVRTGQQSMEWSVWLNY